MLLMKQMNLESSLPISDGKGNSEGNGCCDVSCSETACQSWERKALPSALKSHLKMCLAHSCSAALVSVFLQIRQSDDKATHTQER